MDCEEALSNGEELSESEQSYKDLLITLCRQIANEYGGDE